MPASASDSAMLPRTGSAWSSNAPEPSRCCWGLFRLGLNRLVKPDHVLGGPVLAAEIGADDVRPVLLPGRTWGLLLGTDASQLAMMGPVKGPGPWLGTVADGL